MLLGKADVGVDFCAKLPQTRGKRTWCRDQWLKACGSPAQPQLFQGSHQENNLLTTGLEIIVAFWPSCVTTNLAQRTESESESCNTTEKQGNSRFLVLCEQSTLGRGNAIFGFVDKALWSEGIIFLVLCGQSTLGQRNNTLKERDFNGVQAGMSANVKWHLSSQSRLKEPHFLRV